jgi:hypothetical protein
LKRKPPDGKCSLKETFFPAYNPSHEGENKNEGLTGNKKADSPL